MNKSKIRVTLIHNIISLHIIPVLKNLNNYFTLKVLFCAKTESNRKWRSEINDFDYKVLHSLPIEFKGKDLFTYFITPSIVHELTVSKPDVVIICGWDLFAYQLAFIYCKIKKIKIILWSGSTVYESSWRRVISRPLVRFIIKGSDAYIAYGTRAKEYLESMGANQNKIFISYNTTDIEKYHSLTNKYKKRVDRTKKEMGLENKKAILFYGQLIERKGIDILIDAFLKIRQQIDDLTLLIIGNGSMRDKLINLSKGTKDIRFIDDPGDEKICKYYSIVDLLVLPSREEVWGLVVNQALACGVPVVVSDRVGAAPDLVANGKNGYVFDGSISDLIDKIQTLLKNDEISKTRKNFYQNAEFIKPKNTIKTIVKAINKVYH